MEINLFTDLWEPWITIEDGDWCYPRNGHWFSWTWHGNMNRHIGISIHVDELMRMGKWKLI